MQNHQIYKNTFEKEFLYGSMCVFGNIILTRALKKSWKQKQVSACSAELVPLPEDISQNTLDSCDTLSMSINKVSSPMQNFTDSPSECYVRLVRLPENITPTQAVKASEFNSFKCVNTSRQHISSEKCHYIELDNHSSYCLTCKQLIQDFHQFNQSIQGWVNESSFCSSSFNRHKASEYRGLSTHDNKLSTAAVETELNVNEDEKNQEQNLINKQKRKIDVYKCSICKKQFIHKRALVDHMKFHTNAESFKYLTCDYSANEILETTDPILATKQEEDEYKDVELKNEEMYVDKAIKVETKENSKIICLTPEPNFEMLSNASEEDTLEPDFENIKIDILEDPVNLKLNFDEDEFKKNIQSQGDESPFCSSTFDSHNKSSDVPVETKFIETEQNGNNVSTKNTAICPICNKKMLNNSNLKRHMLTHTGEKHFECNICQKRYTGKASLEYHVKSHTGEKPFRCTECDYTAKLNKEVQRHYNNMHAVKVANTDGTVNTKKTSVCRICNKEILQINLKRHMLTHTGEKPFQCNICQKCFTAKASLKNHTQLHREGKPLCCTEPHLDNVRSKILETINPTTAVNLNLKGNSENTENNKHNASEEEAVLEPHFQNIGSNVLEATDTTSEPHLATLSNASEENLCEPHFQNIKIEILEATNPIVAVNLQLDFSQSQGNESPFCSSTFDNHNKSSDVPIETKFMETEQNGNNVSTMKCIHAVCPICSKKIRDSNLKRHMLTHTGEKPFQCNICQKRYTTKESLEYHIKSHTGEKPFCCTECNYSAKLKTQIRSHYNYIHRVKVVNSDWNNVNTKKIICPICNKRISKLKRHMLSHTGAKPYECNICQKRYTTKTSLEYHIQSHTGEKPYRCTICNYSAKLNKEVQNHYNRIHAVKVANSNGNNANIKKNSHTEEKPFRCTKCDYSAKLRKQVREHYSRMHTVRAPKSDGNNVNTKKTICPICNKKILNSNLKRHMLTHTGEKPFKCNICQKRYTAKTSLEYHIKSHTGENPFRCTECDYSAKLKKQIRSHYNYIHTVKVANSDGNNVNTKKIICPICNKRIFQLKRHMLSHTGEKPFKCNICQKCYTTKNALQYHINWHTGKRPFRCTECDYSARSNERVRRHYNYMHAVGEKPFKCNICQKQYMTKDSLEYHVKFHTEEKLFRCTECYYSARLDKQVREHYNRMHFMHAYKAKPAKTSNISHPGNLRQFECDVCQKCFRNRAFLIHHRKTHTGEKSFKCMECDYSARDSNTLQNHYKNNHTFFVIEEGNVEQPRLVNIQSEKINPAVAVNQNLKCNSENAENIQHNASEEEALEPHFQNIRRNIFEATNSTSKPRFDSLGSVSEEDTRESHFENIKIEILEATDATSEPHLDTLNNASKEDACEPHLESVKSKVFPTTDPPSEPHFDTLSNAFEEEACKSHLQNVRSNILEAVSPTVALNFERKFEEPEHIQNCIHEEIKEKDKATHINTHTEDNTKSSEATYLKEQPEYLQAIKPEEVQIKDELTCEDNLIFPAVQEDEDDLGKRLRISTAEQPYVSNICKFETANGDMYIHSDDKPFTCSLCKYKTVCRKYLKKHMRTHSAEKPFLCSICGFKTSHNYYLQRHLRIHTEEKPFACDLCHFRSKHKHAVTNHMLIHSGEKQFACDLCEYKTAHKKCLQRHMAHHSGEKLYACSLCSFGCASKKRLQEHIEAHKRRRVFVCKICKFQTHIKWLLKRHNCSPESGVDNIKNESAEVVNIVADSS